MLMGAAALIVMEIVAEKGIQQKQEVVIHQTEAIAGAIGLFARNAQRV